MVNITSVYGIDFSVSPLLHCCNFSSHIGIHEGENFTPGSWPVWRGRFSYVTIKLQGSSGCYTWKIENKYRAPFKWVPFDRFNLVVIVHFDSN